MEATIQNFTNNVDTLFARVEDIREPLVVERVGENMVILAQMDYNGIMETLYQMSSPVNEKLVDDALRELRSGGGSEYKIGQRTITV
jgi:PHD/YefM family antitoxin component YafN of YafNO toxin-antitoxin module